MSTTSHRVRSWLVRSLLASVFLYPTWSTHAQVTHQRPSAPHVAPTSTTPGTPKVAERRYAMGPLRSEEFLGLADMRTNREASTMTRVMFQYRFASRRTGRRVEVSLSSLNAYAIFLPQESWWKVGDNPQLLDHEQGHFDLAEIAARRVELVFARLRRKQETLQTVATTEKAAADALLEKLEKVLKAVNDQAIDENADYDRRTRHGANQIAQAEHRRIHSLTLTRLERELAELSRGDRSAVKRNSAR